MRAAASSAEQWPRSCVLHLTTASSVAAYLPAAAAVRCSVPVWLLVGLGARGLVYHAWLGKLMAAAVLDNSEDHLPPELLAWRQQVSTNGCSTVNSQ